jgi:hypothetical protein
LGLLYEWELDLVSKFVEEFIKADAAGSEFRNDHKEPEILLITKHVTMFLSGPTR